MQASRKSRVALPVNLLARLSALSQYLCSARRVIICWSQERDEAPEISDMGVERVAGETAKSAIVPYDVLGSAIISSVGLASLSGGQ